MMRWLFNILLILLLGFAAFKIRQANTINHPIITSLLSEKDTSKFKSDVPGIDYDTFLQLVYSSVDLNTKVELSQVNNLYVFHFVYNLDKKVSWSLLLEKQEDILILKEINDIESFESIIYCN